MLLPLSAFAVPRIEQQSSLRRYSRPARSWGVFAWLTSCGWPRWSDGPWCPGPPHPRGWWSPASWCCSCCSPTFLPCKFSFRGTVTHWPSSHQGFTYLGCLPDNSVKIIEMFLLLIQPSPNSLSSKQSWVQTDTWNIWSVRPSIHFCCCRDRNWKWGSNERNENDRRAGPWLSCPAASWPPRQMWDKQD